STSCTATAVNGSSLSCTAARIVTGTSDQAVKVSVYAAPAKNGTPFWPMPASHGFSVPPGMSAQSAPLTTPSESVPYDHQGETPSSKLPLCSSSSVSPDAGAPISETSSRQMVASSALPPTWNATCPLVLSTVEVPEAVKVCGSAVRSTSIEMTVVNGSSLSWRLDRIVIGAVAVAVKVRV